LNLELRLNILEWIFKEDVNSRHKKISSSRVENSGRWLLESNMYKDWMAGKGSDVFACHGHGIKRHFSILLIGTAGVGKTVLAYTIPCHACSEY
jgi:DNA replication protein DnaC